MGRKSQEKGLLGCELLSPLTTDVRLHRVLQLKNWMDIFLKQKWDIDPSVEPKVCVFELKCIGRCVCKQCVNRILRNIKKEGNFIVVFFMEEVKFPHFPILAVPLDHWLHNILIIFCGHIF